MSLAFGVFSSAVLLLSPWLLGPRAEMKPLEVPWYLRLVWYLNRFYCGLFHKLEVPAGDPLPPEGPVLLVANHTCGIDHLVLQSATRRPLGFVIAQEYYDLPVIHWFCKAVGCIPVKRDGRDLGATRAVLRALESGHVVPIFPEGRINPAAGREFLPARPGAAWVALKKKVPVIPAYIAGTPETNEIPRSLWTPSAAKVVFGPPIELEEFRGSAALRDPEILEQASLRIMKAISDLKLKHAAESHS